jgi:hypothetical protein
MNSALRLHVVYDGHASVYALRRKSAARTRARNCSGVSGGEAGAGFGFTIAGATVFAAFFAALRAANFPSCLVAKSFAAASTASGRKHRSVQITIEVLAKAAAQVTDRELRPR